MSKTLTDSGNLLSKAWYSDLVRITSEIQFKEKKDEDEKWENKRKPYLDQLKKEIEILDELDLTQLKDSVESLKKNFPLKHKAKDAYEKLGECPKNSRDKRAKKFMVKLIQLFHPDKIDRKKFDMKYIVLCEEISKKLTNHYNSYMKLLA